MRHPWSEDDGAGAFREELVAQLDDFERGEFIASEKAALHFVEKFNYDHMGIDEADVAELHRFFDDAAIVELAQVTGGYLFRHRLNEVIGLEAR